MPEPIDFQTVDLDILLSDRSVQQLLDIVHEHPDWSIQQMVDYHPKNAGGKLLLNYEQARAILTRLRLHKRILRRLRQSKLGAWEETDNGKVRTDISEVFPDFLSYLKHRQVYKQFKKQQPPQSALPPAAPVPAVPLATFHRPQQRQAFSRPITPTQQATFKQFDRFFALTKQFSLTALISFLFFFVGSLFFDSVFHATSLVARIGMFFAFTALTLGLFFFIYSLKYYLTIGIILSFSRSEPAATQDSWFAKLFGFSVSIEETGTTGSTSITSTTGGKTAKRSGLGLQADIANIQLKRQPFVSVHVATYNEKRVIDRFLLAATALDYPNYEVIVADDSTDETVQLLEQWKFHPKVKISHRTTREGFKGGALQQALLRTDPKAEFILIFDADFIPYPDAITQFLKYFQASASTLDFSQGERVKGQALRVNEETISQRPSPFTLVPSPCNLAAVQGYQWHVLNKSENWITRGVRTEYSGSYVIERSGAEVYQGLKQISGSVYMIRRDILQSIGWGKSITEDFELTLKLYEQGFKVLYTPYIQTPAEAVSTIKRLIRQRMRWAEGHSYNVKRMFVPLLFGRQTKSPLTPVKQAGSCSSSIPPLYQGGNQPVPSFVKGGPGWISSPLTLSEKLEFLYLAPYYLQAFFFILGTLCWFVSEALFRVRLPFWTEVWGWSLVLTNLCALPLMNLIGLFMEDAQERDYLGLISFILLSYIIAPFQAFAAVKGFLEKEEGPWFRTPKTGRITDSFVPGRFYRFIQDIFGRPAVSLSVARERPLTAAVLALTGNQPPFHSATGTRKRIGWISRTVLIFLLILTTFLSSLPWVAKPVLATNPSDTHWYFQDQDIGAQDAANTQGSRKNIYCFSSTDCRVSYYDTTAADLWYMQCTSADCETNTKTLIDGWQGCSLTGCATSGTIGDYNAIYCTDTSHCFIAYRDTTTATYHVKFAECTNAACTSGNVSTVDGDGNTNLTGTSSLSVGRGVTIFCLSTTDCKLVYVNTGNNNFAFANCTNATCTSGAITDIDGSGCTPTGCTTANNQYGYNSGLYCFSDTDCKIAHQSLTNTTLNFIQCTAAACTTANYTVVDGSGCNSTNLTGCSTTDSRGASSGLWCVSSTDCKIAERDGTTHSLYFVECTNAACSTGKITLLDGGTNCKLTNCSTTDDTGSRVSIYCTATDSCAISHKNNTNTALYFADCTSADCTSGYISKLDGVASCTLTNCDSTSADNIGDYDNIWCAANNDCKIVYYDTAHTNLKFARCTATDCSSGQTITVDGNKMVNATRGIAANGVTFGTSGQTYTLVTDLEYPNGFNTGSLGAGTYTLNLYVTNGITSGTLTWKYEVGYCTVASDCGTKTAVATSSNQTCTQASCTTSGITASGSTTSLPLPKYANWLYVKLSVVSAGTGTITINQDGNTAGTNDSNVQIPALTVSERIFYFLPVAFLVPFVMRVIRRKKIYTYEKV